DRRQRLEEWIEWHRLLELVAPSGRDQEMPVASLERQLLRQTRLADSRLTGKEQQAAAASRHRLERRHRLLPLAGAADERSRGQRAQEAADRQRLFPHSCPGRQ